MLSPLWGGYCSCCFLPCSCRILPPGILSLLRNERAFRNCWTCHKHCALVLSFCAKLYSCPKQRCSVLLPNTPMQQQEESETEAWKKCALRTAAGDNSSSTAKWPKQQNKEIKQQRRGGVNWGKVWKEWGGKNMKKRRRVSESRSNKNWSWRTNKV